MVNSSTKITPQDRLEGLRAQCAEWAQYDQFNFVHWICVAILDIPCVDNSVVDYWREKKIEWRGMQKEFRFLAEALLEKTAENDPDAEQADTTLFSLAKQEVQKIYPHGLRYEYDLFRRHDPLNLRPVAYELFGFVRREKLDRVLKKMADWAYHGVPFYRRDESGEILGVRHDDPILVFLRESSKLGAFPMVWEPPSWMKDLFVKQHDIRIYKLFNFRRSDSDLETTKLRTALLKQLGVEPESHPVKVEGQVHGPEYLDSSHQRYAPKLAAAVRAWLAVTDSGKKSPKQAVEIWLNDHAAELGIADHSGKPVKQAIEEISKVANWKPKGGAAKTPG